MSRHPVKPGSKDPPKKPVGAVKFAGSDEFGSRGGNHARYYGLEAALETGEGIPASSAPRSVAETYPISMAPPDRLEPQRRGPIRKWPLERLGLIGQRFEIDVFRDLALEHSREEIELHSVAMIDRVSRNIGTAISRFRWTQTSDGHYPFALWRFNKFLIDDFRLELRPPSPRLVVEIIRIADFDFHWTTKAAEQRGITPDMIGPGPGFRMVERVLPAPSFPKESPHSGAAEDAEDWIEPVGERDENGEILE